MAESAALLVDDVFPREPIRQWVDGVYVEDAYGRIRFHRIKAPTVDELGALVWEYGVSSRIVTSTDNKCGR